MMITRRDAAPRENGIALIVVLGFLSIIILLAVAFSISMRTELLATRNYVNIVRAKQVAQAAAVRIMEAIDIQCSEDFYPMWDIIGSTSGSKPLATDLISGYATNYLNRDFINASAWAESNVRWQNLTTIGDMTCRYAYVVMNCSGYLDANEIGGKARNRGTNAQEIVVTINLPDIKSITNYFNARTFIGRYENMSELGLYGVQSNAIYSTNPRDLFCYSYFPPESRWHSTLGYVERVNIGTNIDEIINNAKAISNALIECGLPGDLYWNLLEYVDNDSTPNRPDPATALACYNTEPVPMINEIVVSNRLTLISSSNSVYRHDVFIYVETWYPFAGNSPACTLVGISAPDPAISFPLCIPNDLNPDPDGLGFSPSSTFSHSPFSFRTNVFVYSITASNVVFNNASKSVGLTTQIREFQIQIGGNPVDRIEGTPNLANLIINSASLAVGSSVGSQDGVSCLDPRINWRINDFQKEIPTIGRTNNNCNINEGPSEMFVRNGPLKSVAELGYLSVGEPWKTIRLYKPADPVLGVFCIGTPGIRKGLVNLNSLNTNVLAAAFYQCPVDPYPGITNYTLGWNDARKLAKGIIDYAIDNNIVYSNISDIGRCTNEFINVGTYSGEEQLTTDARKEAVIRNTYELFGLRQNLFTVILAAQILDSTGQPMADRRAILYVWRDPVPDATGKRAMFTRMFKWLVE